MPFTFKPSKRLAISKAVVAGVAVAVVAACEIPTGAAAVTVVAIPIASVTVSPATATVSVGGTQQLTATPKDATGTPLTGRVVTWASTNVAVATLDGGGVVRGVSAGTAIITATSEGKSGSAALTVLAGPARIDTVFAEDFESGTLTAWQDGVDPTRQRVVTDPTFAQSGSRYLEVTYLAGGDGGWLTRFFMPGYDSLYVSYYVRLEPAWQGGTKLVAFYGSRVDNQWSALGKAGICPNGTDFFATWVVDDPPMKFYMYYPAMAREPDGVTCWGRNGDGTETYAPPLALSVGVWHHIEFWVKLNTPGQNNASQTFWLDGVRRGDWSGFSFRSSAVLMLNSVQLTFNRGISGGPTTQKLYVDNLVVTTARPTP
jgi:hypothetical protein